MEKVVLSWSGGKDSALAFLSLIREKRYEIVTLLTTVTRDYNRISMHGVRVELLKEQANKLSKRLDIVTISKGATNEEYEQTMMKKTKEYSRRGVSRVAFGDIFLEDVRQYREERTSQAGMECLFPLWGQDTRKLATEFINLGFKAVICTVDPRKLGREYAGREFDESFVSDLPQGVDPCGENGEFHSFVYDGPIFRTPISVIKGEVKERDGFIFVDILARED